MGFQDRMNAKSYGGQCVDCTNSNRAENIRVQTETSQEQLKADAEIDAVLVVTAHTLQGVTISMYLGVITAECAYGMNIFKDLFASIRNIVGGRSKAVQDTMRDARETVLLELKREAHQRGANAVIAIDLDYTQVGDGGAAMVLLVASGTAVVIEE
ncbi:YbjQ family protein [Litoreibacter janthinus]|nr:YbjQ family protein [Litoreibacter janthinus]